MLVCATECDDSDGDDTDNNWFCTTECDDSDDDGEDNSLLAEQSIPRQ